MSWAPWREARLALVYLAFGSELDPLAALPGGGGTPQLATTRTPSDGAALTLHRLDRGQLERHPLGYWQPRQGATRVQPAQVDVVLVPGLCFDVTGRRLGYGRGYYDRLLPLLPARAQRVGVCDAGLVVERLPHEPHDMNVAWLLTETGLRRTQPDA